MSGRSKDSPIQEEYTGSAILSVGIRVPTSFSCAVTSALYRKEEHFTACVDVVTGELAYLLAEELDGYILAEDGTKIVI